MTDLETVYLDHNATSPLLPCAREALLAVLDGPAGNPSSVHRDGAHARAVLDRSRATLAEILGARPEQIVFTAGGTESNNLAITGAAHALLADPRRSADDSGPVFVTSTVEHPSVLLCFEALEELTSEVRRVPPDEAGLIHAGAVRSTIRDAASALVSVQLANHETGALHPIGEISAALRGSSEPRPNIVLHSDAVQGFGKVPFAVRELGVDLLSISAHKVGGPIGIGALFVRDPALLSPLTFGGKQEGGIRPGTASPALAAAFAAAASYRVSHLTQATEELRALRARLRDRLTEALANQGVSLLIQTPESSVPNTLSISIPGVDREALLVSLDLLGFRVSAGAACSSGAAGPSPVLLAMGRDEVTANSTVRISLGSETRADSIDRFVDAFGSVLPRVI